MGLLEEKQAVPEKPKAEEDGWRRPDEWEQNMVAFPLEAAVKDRYGKKIRGVFGYGLVAVLLFLRAVQVVFIQRTGSVPVIEMFAVLVCAAMAVLRWKEWRMSAQLCGEIEGGFFQVYDCTVYNLAPEGMYIKDKGGRPCGGPYEVEDATAEAWTKEPDMPFVLARCGTKKAGAVALVGFPKY